MFRRILLASDGSNHSERAGEKALNLAKLSGAAVEVLYVVDGATSKADVLQNWNSISINDRRREKLNRIQDKANKSKIDITITILKGEPGPTIVKYVNDNNIDVVVIGSRGLNTLQEMVLGSVSHKVAKRVHCPVLIVK